MTPTADQQAERDHAVALLRSRARDYRTHAVYELLLRHSKALAPLPPRDRELRGHMACQLAHALADELEAAATLLQYGNHWFELQHVKD